MSTANAPQSVEDKIEASTEGFSFTSFDGITTEVLAKLKEQVLEQLLRHFGDAIEDLGEKAGGFVEKFIQHAKQLADDLPGTMERLGRAKLVEAALDYYQGNSEALNNLYKKTFGTCSATKYAILFEAPRPHS